jgi:hypothetical protein
MQLTTNDVCFIVADIILLIIALSVTGVIK